MQDLDYWKNARGEQLKQDERKFLYLTAKEIADKFSDPVIVNIGVSWGASLHCLYAGADSTNHYAIDIDYDTRPVQGKELLPTVTFIKADSGYLLFRPQIAHLVFVDGDHSYNGVRRDIDNWTMYIPAGGIIVFHDYAPNERDKKRLEGVKRAIDEWYNANDENWIKLIPVGSIISFIRIG